jgi:hypothetical protein
MRASLRMQTRTCSNGAANAARISCSLSIENDFAIENGDVYFCVLDFGWRDVENVGG